MNNFICGGSLNDLDIGKGVPKKICLSCKTVYTGHFPGNGKCDIEICKICGKKKSGGYICSCMFKNNSFGQSTQF